MSQADADGKATTANEWSQTGRRLRSPQYIVLYRQFLIALAALIILYVPLVQAGFYATDDFARTLLGYNDLTPAGRPLAALVIWILNVGSPITDIAPAPQYLAIIVLAAASVVIARAFDMRSLFAVVSVAVAFGGNPFFFGNMMFRIDSVTMAMATLLAVLPLLWMRTCDWTSVLLSGVVLLSALMLYQFAVNCYLVMSFFLTALHLRDVGLKQSARALCFYLAPFLLAGSAYWVASPYMFDFSGLHYSAITLLGAKYVSMLIEIAPPSQLLSTIGKNLVTAFLGLLSVWHLNVLGAVWAISFAVAVATIASRSRNLLRGGILAAAAAAFFFAATILLLLCSVVGIHLPLSHAPFLIRTVIGWGALLAACTVVLHLASSKWVRAFGGVLLTVQALATYSVAYSYANALSDQKRYEDRIAGDIAKDIRSMNGRQFQRLSVSGFLEVSPMTRNVQRKYHLARSIYSELREDDPFAAIRLQWVGVDLSYSALSADERKRMICSSTPAVDNRLYSLYGAGDLLLLRFKNDSVEC